MTKSLTTIPLLLATLSDALSDRSKSQKIDFGGGYIKLRTLGGGASAVAYEVLKGGKRYALKKSKTRGNVLSDEYNVLRELYGYEGVPKAYDLFKCRDGTDCLVLELVGPSLSELHKNFRVMDQLPLESIGAIAIQLIDRMEAFHKKGFVHGDLFGNNISPGRGDSKGTIYAIDFGQASRLRDSSSRTKSFDAQSVAYTIANMIKNSIKSVDSVFESHNMKNLPNEILDLVTHVEAAKNRGDRYLDYGYMRTLMISMIKKTGKKFTIKVNWPSEILRKLP